MASMIDGGEQYRIPDASLQRKQVDPTRGTVNSSTASALPARVSNAAGMTTHSVTGDDKPDVWVVDGIIDDEALPDRLEAEDSTSPVG